MKGDCGKSEQPDIVDEKKEHFAFTSMKVAIAIFLPGGLVILAGYLLVQLAHKVYTSKKVPSAHP